MPRPTLAPPALPLLALLWTCLAPAPPAQTLDPVYVLVRGAVAGAEGDLGGAFDEPGIGLGLEAGYAVSERVAVGVGLWYQDLPALSDGFRYLRQPNVQGSSVYQAQLLARLRPVDLEVGGRPVSPFVEAGGALVAGPGTEAERNVDGSNDSVLGFGPVVGLGVDLGLSPRLGLHLGVQSTVVLPDVALDGADPSAFADDPAPPPGALADNTGYDVLTNVTAGLRYRFSMGSRASAPGPAVPPARRPDPVTPEPVTPEPVTPEPVTPEPVTPEPVTPEPVTPEARPEPVLEVARLTCPSDLRVGQAAAFEVRPRADSATSARWTWGDGTQGRGEQASHAFSAPGTYTVTATVAADGREASEACVVAVLEAVRAPRLTSCSASPFAPAAGEPVSVTASAVGAETITVDFGDGETASAVPARHAYEPGTFTITITSQNEAGVDDCTIEVEVSDPLCSRPIEVEPVLFEFGMDDLSPDAMARLDAAAEAALRCPSVCLALEGYGDGAEPGDAARLSQRRADAARLYYIGQGVEAERIEAVGRGVAADADARTDDGPGDERGRRVVVTSRTCPGR